MANDRYTLNATDVVCNGSSGCLPDFDQWNAMKNEDNSFVNGTHLFNLCCWNWCENIRGLFVLYLLYLPWTPSLGGGRGNLIHKPLYWGVNTWCPRVCVRAGRHRAVMGLNYQSTLYTNTWFTYHIISQTKACAAYNRIRGRGGGLVTDFIFSQTG